MQVRRFDDITAFREVATPYLVRDEARHNLILGILDLMQKPDLHPVFDLWVASDGDEVTERPCGRRRSTWSSPSPRTIPLSMRSSTGLIAEGQDLPGVVAAIPEVETFVGAWTAGHDVDAAIASGTIYELREVMDVPSAPGGARPVTPEDREQVIAWPSPSPTRCSRRDGS